MRKASKYIIPSALAIMMLAGCGNAENEPEVNGSKDCPNFSATIGEVQTRAFDRQWESGDAIGISGANRTNVCYHTEDGLGNFTVRLSGDQIYFQHDDETAFTAYYPWNDLKEAGSIKADTRNQADQKKFDFLWAAGSGKKTAPNVAFEFAHVMTKVVLTVKPGTGMTYDEFKKAALSLEGFRHSGSFNVADGSTSLDEAGEIWNFTEFAKYDDAEKTATYSFIFIPQVLDKALEFSAVLEMPDNKSHSLKANIDFTGANKEKDGESAKNEWVAGRQYNLSVTLNKTEISLNGCEIKPWNEVTGEDIIVD